MQQNFDHDEVKNFIQTSVEATLGPNTYNAKKVQQWTSQIIETILKQLSAGGKPFKYVGECSVFTFPKGRCDFVGRSVTCVVMQKNGAGLYSASTCYWDTKTDGQSQPNLDAFMRW